MRRDATQIVLRDEWVGPIPLSQHTKLSLQRMVMLAILEKNRDEMDASGGTNVHPPPSEAVLRARNDAEAFRAWSKSQGIAATVDVAEKDGKLMARIELPAEELRELFDDDDE